MYVSIQFNDSVRDKHCHVLVFTTYGARNGDLMRHVNVRYIHNKVSLTKWANLTDCPIDTLMYLSGVIEHVSLQP